MKNTSTSVYKLKCNDCLKLYIGQTQYTEHIKVLTKSLMKSKFAEHIFNTHHTYTNIETNLENQHILLKVP